MRRLEAFIRVEGFAVYASTALKRFLTTNGFVNEEILIQNAGKVKIIR